jgi:phenylacetate-coenzyme A ligase PaaK-like adenylate-forming protein
MDSVKRLFRLHRPYQTRQSDLLFVKAMRENCAWHYEHCPEYKAILDRANFKPEMIKTSADLVKIPVIPTLFFKHHEMDSRPKKKMILRVTSSGTSGQNQSKIGFDLYTILRAWEMTKHMLHYHHLWSLKPTHFVVFGYQPHKGNNKAIAKSAWGFTFTAPALSKDYAIRWIDGDYRVDLESIEKKLIRYAKGHHQVRSLGFPAYTFFLLKKMKEDGVHVTLPKGSKMTLGGGWKQFYAEACSKQEFYDLAHEVLGLHESDIVEFFGAVEHPVLWTTCSRHHFHVPVYARVIIRDPDTFEELPHGQMGLINLLTPISRGAPLTSIVTDDLGILHDEECGCGIHSPYLEIVGRVGLEDIKTCAAGADDLLKGKKA